MADTICHATQGGLLMIAPFIARIRRKAVPNHLVLG